MALILIHNLDQTLGCKNMLDKLETKIQSAVAALFKGLRAVRDYFVKLWKEIKDVWVALKGRD